MSSVQVHTCSPILFPVGPGNRTEALSGAEHAGGGLGLLPRWRHGPCGRGGGVAVECVTPPTASAAEAPQEGGKGSSSSPPPPTHNTGQEVLGGKASGRQENKPRTLSRSTTFRAPALCASTTPPLTDAHPAAPLSQLHGAPRHRSAALFCLLIFSFASKSTEGTDLKSFPGKRESV